MFLAKKLNRGAGTPAAPADAQFNYVTMLLHGDGTNGAQNNTFVDSSSNNFTITRNGNTTQGSFSPYGSNWSNFFDGTGDYLSLASNAAFAFNSGDFTVEFWMQSDNASSAAADRIYRTGDNNATGNLQILISGTAIRIDSGVSTLLTGSVNVVNSSWHHIAVTRSGTSLKLFVDGTQDGSTVTNSTNFTTQVPQIAYDTAVGSGSEYTGYLSNLRVVKGTAVYTSNFTPSTTPLTAISGTSLLTCADNRFIDDSTNNFAITVNGTPSVQRFNPFGTSTAYSTSVIGGSGYFDGSGDYLGVPYSANLTMTGDFTAECWVYVTSAPQAYGGILAFSNDSENVGWNILIGGTTTKFHFNVAMTYTDTATSMTLNAWTHLALVRSGSTGKLYINGVADANTVTTSATATCPTNPQIGRYPLISDRNFFGYISNVRVVKGTAVYTSNFTPPTAPVTSITNTQLLLNYTNGAIFDNAMMNDLETVGNAQISTSVKKYGTGSLAFDGSGDYLSTRSTPNLSFGSGDFTIECWVYANSLGSYNAVFAQWPDNGGTANNSYTLETVGSNMEFYYASGTTLYGPTTLGTITTGVWIHYAICRSGNTLYPFKNGVLGTTTSITQTLNSPTSAVTIGGAVAGGGSWNGYIDDLRITKGYARYTTTFTPPTKALSDTGP